MRQNLHIDTGAQNLQQKFEHGCSPKSCNNPFLEIETRFKDLPPKYLKDPTPYIPNTVTVTGLTVTTLILLVLD